MTVEDFRNGGVITDNTALMNKDNFFLLNTLFREKGFTCVPKIFSAYVTVANICFFGSPIKIYYKFLCALNAAQSSGALVWRALFLRRDLVIIALRKSFVICDLLLARRNLVFNGANLFKSSVKTL